MLSGIPNLAMAIGYTNSSWTLKIGLLCDYFCRLLAHLDEHDHDAVWPVADPDMETRPLLDFGAGYLQRALATLPQQGVAAPWLMSMNYHNDAKVLRRGARRRRAPRVRQRDGSGHLGACRAGPLAGIDTSASERSGDRPAQLPASTSSPSAAGASTKSSGSTVRVMFQ